MNGLCFPQSAHISLDVPTAPRALIVAVTSPSSVTVSWVPGPNRQTGSLLPVLHEVTLSELETGLVIRRINVSNTDRLGQQRQIFDSLTAGSYQVAVSAGNVFGRSRSLSLNFDITGMQYMVAEFDNLPELCIFIHM